MKKMLRVGDDFNMVQSEDSESSDTYSVRNVMNLTALNLADDIKEYRNGNKELKELIPLEIMALNALVAATNAMK